MSEHNNQESIKEKIRREEREFVDWILNRVAKIIAPLRIIFFSNTIKILIIGIIAIFIFKPTIITNFVNNEQVNGILSEIPLVKDVIKLSVFNKQEEVQQVVYKNTVNLESEIEAKTNYKIRWISLKNTPENKEKLNNILTDVKAYCNNFTELNKNVDEIPKLKKYITGNKINLYENAFVEASSDEEYVNIICKTDEGITYEDLKELEGIYRVMTDSIIENTIIHKTYRIGTKEQDYPYVTATNSRVSEEINLINEMIASDKDDAQYKGYNLAKYILDKKIFVKYILDNIALFRDELGVVEGNDVEDIRLKIEDREKEESNKAKYIVKNAEYISGTKVKDKVNDIQQKVNNENAVVEWSAYRANRYDENIFVVIASLNNNILGDRGYIDIYLYNNLDNEITPVEQSTKVVNLKLNKKLIELDYITKEDSKWPFKSA